MVLYEEVVNAIEHCIKNRPNLKLSGVFHDMHYSKNEFPKEIYTFGNLVRYENGDYYIEFKGFDDIILQLYNNKMCKFIKNNNVSEGWKRVPINILDIIVMLNSKDLI